MALRPIRPGPSRHAPKVRATVVRPRGHVRPDRRSVPGGPAPDDASELPSAPGLTPHIVSAEPGRFRVDPPTTYTGTTRLPGVVHTRAMATGGYERFPRRRMAYWRSRSRPHMLLWAGCALAVLGAAVLASLLGR